MLPSIHTLPPRTAPPLSPCTVTTLTSTATPTLNSTLTPQLAFVLYNHNVNYYADMVRCLDPRYAYTCTCIHACTHAHAHARAMWTWSLPWCAAGSRFHHAWVPSLGSPLHPAPYTLHPAPCTLHLWALTLGSHLLFSLGSTRDLGIEIRHHSAQVFAYLLTHLHHRRSSALCSIRAVPSSPPSQSISSS